MDIQLIQNKIFEIRGHRVLLDFQIAEMYGVETRVLNQAVKRNLSRFPADFMIKLNSEEWAVLKSQIVISKAEKRGGTQKLPYAFTEQGIAILSSVLKSRRAIAVNISIMRAFVLLRQHLSNYKDLKEEIKKLEKEMNLKFKDIYEAFNYLMSPKSQPLEIGSKQKGRNRNTNKLIK